VISAFSTILLHAKIGKHCILETYCLVAHYSELKDNVIMHVGTMIAGKTTVGNNCLFNFKSSAINNIIICDNVEVGAFSNITKNVTMPGRYLGSVARYSGAITTFGE
jgi:UDP-3-O-[3-hydroxymyristoyl] glucosamine N-acyltransferase